MTFSHAIFLEHKVTSCCSCDAWHISHHSSAWLAIRVHYLAFCQPHYPCCHRLLQPKTNDIKSKVTRIAFVNSEAIRKHFFELTSAFLAPFNRCSVIQQLYSWGGAMT